MTAARNYQNASPVVDVVLGRADEDRAHEGVLRLTLSGARTSSPVVRQVAVSYRSL